MDTEVLKEWLINGPRASLRNEPPREYRRYREGYEDAIINMAHAIAKSDTSHKFGWFEFVRDCIAGITELEAL